MARLVIKGCAQRKGLDHPVKRYTSIRMLLSIAAKLDLQNDQMDSVTGFLEGILIQDIYMPQKKRSSGTDWKWKQIKLAI